LLQQSTRTFVRISLYPYATLVAVCLSVVKPPSWIYVPVAFVYPWSHHRIFIYRLESQFVSMPADKPDQTPEPSAMTLILNMQQQQLAMQEQMTQLMTKLLPTNHPTESPQRQLHKPERPTIEADSSDNKWIIFTDAWVRYKDMGKLQDLNDIRNELRSSCSSSVNEMLFNFVGPEALKTATEDQLLQYIKSVAVKTVHPEVYRQQFFAMRQSDGESITCFISRLKSQAMLCDFKRKCDCDDRNCCTTSYSEDMIISQLIAGIYNASHQNRVLSEVSALKTLSQVIDRLLILESTARASSHFQPEDLFTSRITPVKSDYQKNKYASLRTPTTPAARKTSNSVQPPKCRGCGRQRHTDRQSQCPAQGQKCHNCGKLNHFATVCMSSSSNAIQSYGTHGEDETVSFINTINSTPQF
jgi:hypothetical protein